MQTRLLISIVTTVGLVLMTPYSQNAFAQNSNTSRANGGVGGDMTGSTGASGAGGGSSGAVIGGGSTRQPVEHHLFCDTGMITPICK